MAEILLVAMLLVGTAVDFYLDTVKPIANYLAKSARSLLQLVSLHPERKVLDYSKPSLQLPKAPDPFQDHSKAVNNHDPATCAPKRAQELEDPDAQPELIEQQQCPAFFNLQGTACLFGTPYDINHIAAPRIVPQSLYSTAQVYGHPLPASFSEVYANVVVVNALGIGILIGLVSYRAVRFLICPGRPPSVSANEIPTSPSSDSIYPETPSNSPTIPSNMARYERRYCGAINKNFTPFNDAGNPLGLEITPNISSGVSSSALAEMCSCGGKICMEGAYREDDSDTYTEVESYAELSDSGSDLDPCDIVLPPSPRGPVSIYKLQPKDIYLDDEEGLAYASAAVAAT